LASAPVSSVTKEVYEFVSATNRPSDLSLSYLDGKYRDQVNYYGKILSKASVLKDKRAFFRKCETTSTCKAEGVLNWEASGDILSSKGSATFSLLWVLEGNIWKISSERSQPVERKVTR
jgi:hypothetical protein